MTSGNPESALPPDRSVTDADLAKQAAQQAEAEAEAAAAEARAEAARARADTLRERLQGAEAVSVAGEHVASPPRPARSRPILAGVAALLTTALLAVTGYMAVQHQQQSQQRQRTAEYVAAARQGIINLMSIDYINAQDSVQRVLDGSIGKFHDNFEESADDFVKALQSEKIVTKATVNDAAVETMTKDSAVVLISASSRREGPKTPKDQQAPRLWRVVLNLQREGDQIKMSGVEFV